MVAGISVACVLVPQSLAYAQLAGVPPTRGLYAASVPPLAAAPFSSSPYLQAGPTAVTALLTFGALTPLAQPASSRYVALGLLLALLVGAIRVAVAALGAGSIAYLLSQPLLLGFVPGAAAVIVASQVPVALGAPAHGKHAFAAAGYVLLHPGRWHGSAAAFALAASLLLLLGTRLPARFPAILIVVALAIGCSELTGYGGATVGSVHAGLPPLTISLPWSDLPRLLVPAVVIALVGFAEAASIARTYAALDRRRWDANREFASQGVANLAAGLFGGFPVGASFSRSALNRLAGARTSASGLVTGLAVLLFLPLAFLLEPLPRSVLAATIVVAVCPLLRIDRIARLFAVSKPQFAIAACTFALTVALEPHLERAVLAGVALSIAVHLWRELRLEVTATRVRDELHLRPLGVLWFGSARVLEDRFVELLAANDKVRKLTIHLGGLGRIDLTGALALRSIVDDARRAGIEVTVGLPPPQARPLLRRVLGWAGEAPRP